MTMSAHRDVPAKLYVFLASRMKYSTPVKVLYEVPVDMKVTLLVIGDPDNAAYEWVLVRDDGSVISFSNQGCGSSSFSLRDGLIAYHGLPNELVNLRKRLMSEPSAGASKERVLSHYADLVGEAIKVIDASGEQS